MRRALRRELPLLTRYTYGALNPLTVEQYTFAELIEYRTRMHQDIDAGRFDGR